MLKIKDNVDLKELKKFTFIYHDDIKSAYYGCCEYYKDSIGVFINNSRIISITNNTVYKSIFELDVLYNLFQAGLVEKVEE